MTQSYSIKPSLNDAYARVRRAKRHLTSFKQHRARLFNPDQGGMRGIAEINARVEGNHGIMSLRFREVPEILPILVGEIIYNLRAALDYLIYELSLLDSNGRIEPRVPQFIIEDSPEGWRSHKWRLKFLSVEHQATIERLQPFNGCSWTAIVRDLSDPDKHRTLSAVAQQATLLFGGEDETETPLPEGEDMSAPFDITGQIEFDDGSPVEEACQELLTNITHVLDSFKPEFE